MSFFCATLSLWYIVDFNNNCVHNFQVFISTKKGQKLCLFQKMRNILIGVFVLMIFFLCDSYILKYGRYCIQQWLTVNWGLAKNLEEIFANLIQMLTSEARVLDPKPCGVCGTNDLAIILPIPLFYFKFIPIFDHSNLK